MEFSRPGDLPNPGIEPRSPELQADSLPAEPQGKPYMGMLLLYKLGSHQSRLHMKNSVSLPSREDLCAHFTERKLRPRERRALTHNHIENVSFGTQ